MFPKLSRTPVNFACSMLHCWGHRKNTVQWLATLIACACRAAPCNKFTKPQLGPSPSLLLLASCSVLTPTLPVAWRTGRRGLGNHLSLASGTDGLVAERGLRATANDKPRGGSTAIARGLRCCPSQIRFSLRPFPRRVINYQALPCEWWFYLPTRPGILYPEAPLETRRIRTGGGAGEASTNAFGFHEPPLTAATKQDEQYVCSIPLHSAHCRDKTRRAIRVLNSTLSWPSGP
jgi:hypothetical protein